VSDFDELGSLSEVGKTCVEIIPPISFSREGSIRCSDVEESDFHSLGREIV
jgi:hypothetical protein